MNWYSNALISEIANTEYIVLIYTTRLPYIYQTLNKLIMYHFKENKCAKTTDRIIHISIYTA
jgi:hypothetical protein